MPVGLRVTVDEIQGECTAVPKPMELGDEFLVYKGKIFTPQGGSICICPLQSLMPFLVARQETIGGKGTTWASKVTRVRCPDPCGHVVFGIRESELSAEELGDVDAAD